MRSLLTTGIPDRPRDDEGANGTDQAFRQHVDRMVEADGSEGELDLRIAFSVDGPPRYELLEVVGDGVYGPGNAGGLHHVAILTDAERAEFTRLNEAYVARHGFPFIIAVRDHDKAGIMAAMTRRLDNDTGTERSEAERQVARIGELRLKAMLD